MLALSAVAVRRGSRRGAEAAPVSVAPAPFPFPGRAAGVWGPRGGWAERRVPAEPAAAEEEAVAVARRREAPGAPVALPSAAPSAAAWAFHRDQLPRGPAARPTARAGRG